MASSHSYDHYHTCGESSSYTTKKARRMLPRQAKSLGQYEFKALPSLSKDEFSQVQERLAVLSGTDSIELTEQSSPPPELPPRDYFTSNNPEDYSIV